MLKENKLNKTTRPISLIENKTNLRSTYKKRKDCLKKKTRELATLCDIQACIVILGPQGELESWPENPQEVQSILNMYKENLKVTEKTEIGSVGFMSILEGKLKEVNARIEAISKSNYETIADNEVYGGSEFSGFDDNELVYGGSEFSGFDDNELVYGGSEFSGYDDNDALVWPCSYLQLLTADY